LDEEFLAGTLRIIAARNCSTPTRNMVRAAYIGGVAEKSPVGAIRGFLFLWEPPASQHGHPANHAIEWGQLRRQWSIPKSFVLSFIAPHCDRTDMQFELLADKEEIACRSCGQMIDITNEQLQRDLREAIESFKKP
jgi:hypothetical protein